MGMILLFKKYLEKVLDIHLIVDEKFKGGELPYFLNDLYNIHRIKVFDNYFVVIIDKVETKLTPENIKKQIEIIVSRTNLDVIYVHPALSSFQRERLIKLRINFVVPDNQMYLPYLKIDLREHFKSLKQTKKHLSPASQAIIIFCILTSYSKLESKIILDNFTYSTMSVSRSFREISNYGIGELIRQDKKNYLYMPESKKNIWEISKAILISPVKQEIWLKNLPPSSKLPYADLSALAEYSMIVPPKNPIYAIYKEEWFKLKKDESVKKLIEPIQTESNIKLQVWSYPPDLLKHSSIVDKYSLYLSLKNDKDERVEQALEDMMEDVLNGYRNR